MGTTAVYALAALLACLCLGITPTASAAHGLVQTPEGKVYVYNYAAVIAAGQNEPTPHSSKFQIQGKVLYKTHDQSKLYLKFHDIKYTVYNGPDDGQVHGNYQALEDAIKDIEEPILVEYKENGDIEGIKMQEKEATWSKNMKRSLAVLMKTNEITKSKEGAELIKEDTIHGTCKVDQVVYNKDIDGQKVYFLHKFYEPRKCSNFVQIVADDAKTMGCNVNSEEDLVTTADRMYVYGSIQNVADYVLKKLTAHEKMSFLPWSHRGAGIQFIETNQTFEFEKMVPLSELTIPTVDFGKIQPITNIAYDKKDYVPHVSTAEEVQFGRYLIKSSDLIVKAKEFLIMVVDYLKEKHIDVEDPHPEHKHGLEKLYRLVSHMDTDSMLYLYKHFNKDSEKGKMTKKIFLQIVPHTGTHAAWRFVRKIIDDKDDIPDEKTVLYMLENLPMYVLDPTEEFAMEMSDISKLDKDWISDSIKRAGVLSYSILLHKVYKNVHTVPKFLKEQLDHFDERIKNENTYQNKILYMMAMRNVEVGNIDQYLIPIIRNGDADFYIKVDIQKPEKYRIAAMWAVAKSISHDRQKTYELFWPLLANRSEPLTVRMTAYELLVTKNPKLDMALLMEIQLLLSVEPNEHLFNYYYTSVQGMAETKDPCMKDVSEMMRKVLRLTKQRRTHHDGLSRVNIFDYYDSKYAHGKNFKIAAVIDEISGIAQMGHYEIVSTFARRPKLSTGYYWNVDGINMNTIIDLVGSITELPAREHEIQNEVVKNLLHQTRGFELLDRHIHVELWTMDKGYVTDVKVFFQNGLIDFLKEYVDSFKPKNIMDVGEKFNRNWLDISFFNHYKMVVATDLGVPAFFYNDAPYLSYTKLKPNIYPLRTVITMKLEFDMRIHRHSTYKMKFYNPFADITQMVQRRVTMDVALPIDMSVSYNAETQNVKILLPRVPETKYSVSGIKVHSVDEVEVGKDYSDLLKTFCPSCQHLTEITKGPMYKKSHEDVYDSKTTGLEYKYSIFDCEKEFAPGDLNTEMFRIMNLETNAVNKDPSFQSLMFVDQMLFNLMNAPSVTTCGVLAKVSPSKVYPTSQVEMNWRFGMAKIGDDVKLNIRGSIDTKAISTNETINFWDVDFETHVSQFFNRMNIKFTRSTPGEKNQKICLEAGKKYPNYISDPDNLKHETETKLNFFLGYTDGDDCVTDETFIKTKIKGELLDYQKEDMARNVQAGSCFKNPNNPLDLNLDYPLDWNCLYEAVKATTLRKYTIDVDYDKIPYELISKLVLLEDYILFEDYAKLKYKPDHTEVGHAKILINYPGNRVYGNVTVINPYYSYEITESTYKSENIEDRRHDIAFDNTMFPTTFLADFYKGETRPCIAHPNNVINDLNQTIPMDFKDWTLMSADIELMTYAIFVKTLPDNTMALRIYARDFVIEVKPGDSKPIVTYNGEQVYYSNSAVIPTDDQPFFKIQMVNKLLVITTEKYYKQKVYYSPKNVIVLPHIIFDRNLDGICGHMGSTTYVQRVPLVYRGS